MKRVCVIGGLAVMLTGCVVGRGGVLDVGDLDAGRGGRRDASGQGGRDGASGEDGGGGGGRDGGGGGDGDGGVGRDGGRHGFDAAAFPDGALPSTEANCDDGVDQDGDGLLDCEDDDCERAACTSGGNLYCVGGTCGGCLHEPLETDCGDLRDEDCDNLTDCADPDCEGVMCGPGVVCGGGTCPCGGGLPELACGDGNDDDCDTLVDCADPDCTGRECGEGGLVCASGACACNGSIEFCNDADEDCDGLADDGCPTGIEVCCGMSAGAFGRPLGSVFSDPCPMGTVLMGMAGRASSRLDQLQPICASLVLETDRSRPDPDFDYPIRRGAAILGATHGGSGGVAFDDRCPGNDVVIGVRVSADDLTGLSSVGLRCGTVVAEHVGLSWRLSVTPSVDLPTRGGAAGSPLGSDCGVGAVSRIDGRADSIVERIGITCDAFRLQTIM